MLVIAVLIPSRVVKFYSFVFLYRFHYALKPTHPLRLFKNKMKKVFLALAQDLGFSDSVLRIGSRE